MNFLTHKYSFAPNFLGVQYSLDAEKLEVTVWSYKHERHVSALLNVVLDARDELRLEQPLSVVSYTNIAHILGPRMVGQRLGRTWCYMERAPFKNETPRLSF